MMDFEIPGLGSPLLDHEANYIEPGKRPISSMSPTIVVDNDNNVRFLFGGAGGLRILSALSKVNYHYCFYYKYYLIENHY